MSFGTSEIGLSFYGASPLFQLLSATALNAQTIRLVFTQQVDFLDSQTTNPANYNIGVVGPGTPLGQPVQVLQDPDPYALRLITAAQEYTQYLITVTNIVSISSVAIDTEANTAEFTGFSTVSGTDNGFLAKVIREDAINLVFLQAMQVDAALLDPSKYTVFNVHGDYASVLTVTTNYPSDATRLVLNLGGALAPNVGYTVQIDPLVKTSSGLSLAPDSAMVVWTPGPRRSRVPLSVFTGEVRAPVLRAEELSEQVTLSESLSVVLTPLRYGPSPSGSFREQLRLQERLTVTGTGTSTVSSAVVSFSETLEAIEKASFTNYSDARASHEASLGETMVLREALEVLPNAEGIRDLFGNPQGLVFFSPALIPGGAPSSSIQVDRVSACTTTYDTYTFPQPIDPKPFYTHGVGVVPTPEVSVLNTAALFADFYRLGEASHSLHDVREESILPGSDMDLEMRVIEVWPPARVALLNSPGWATFDGVAAPPYDFVLADNMSPFPGPTVASPILYFVNVSEVLVASEALTPVHAMVSEVNELVTVMEEFDLDPGDNVVQANVSESLSMSELLETSLTIHLSETLTQTTTLTVTT